MIAHVMQKSAAKKLIEKHRRHWHSQESDIAVARRAERNYFGVGLMFVGIALIDLIESALGAGLTTYRITFAAIILSVGAFFWWQSYRFTRIRRMLTDTETNSN